MSLRNWAVMGACLGVVYGGGISALLAIPDPVPVDKRTGGVPGCSASSSRTVIIPAGATTAFSCPTHIEVSSMDEHTPTTITFRR